MPPYLVEQLMKEVGKLRGEISDMKVAIGKLHTNIVWMRRLGYLVASSVLSQIAELVIKHWPH